MNVNKMFKITLIVFIMITSVCMAVFFMFNGYEYFREVRAEEEITKYLEKNNFKKYDDYTIAIVKVDREIASARVTPSIWVHFEDEPSNIYEYILNSGDELHLMYIKNLTDNKNVEKGKHDSIKYDAIGDSEPLNK